VKYSFDYKRLSEAPWSIAASCWTATSSRSLRDGDTLIAADGRRVEAATATHLAPVSPTKILCCHLNHVSRVREFGISLPPAPTWFQKPVSALNTHGGAVVRPANCHYLNYEGEIAIVIGRTARNIRLEDAGALHRGLHHRQRLRSARLSRHRRRLDAARERRRHALPPGAGCRNDVGL
jgi:2-keto-4-pentenoate hydratase/2-oxohepta-3-ene-1,7-dioic acid hydratase in catechol pathway